MKRTDRNIILIGMPASGKSTIGVLAAKALNMDFIDTDLLIQCKYQKHLWEILQEDGIQGFVEKESQVLSGLSCKHTVISTGGSAVYGKEAMKWLKQNGVVIWLDLPLDTIQKRIQDIHSRGVAIEEGKTLADLYQERNILYQKYADIRVNAEHRSVEQLVADVVSLYQTYITK